MSYIGNVPYQVAFVSDTFNGDGTTTAFTMSVAPANTSSVLVAITGVLQSPSTYSVSGTTLTFSAAPPSGTGNISVRYLGIPASGVTTTAYRTVTDFTATAGQTTFTPPSYTVGFINVYRNGSRLGSADYTATNGTTVVLASAASSGDLVTIESFLVSSVLNAIPNTAYSISRTNLPAGSVLQVVQTVLTTTVSFSPNGAMQAVTGLSASITPTASTSKVLVLVNMAMGPSVSAVIMGQLQRNGSAVGGGVANGSSPSINTAEYYVGSAANTPPCFTGAGVVHYLDSPATTSSVTYAMYIQGDSGAATIYINRTGRDSSSGSAIDGRASSTITLMEIAA